MVYIVQLRIILRRAEFERGETKLNFFIVLIPKRVHLSIPPPKQKVRGVTVVELLLL